MPGGDNPYISQFDFPDRQKKAGKNRLRMASLFFALIVHNGMNNAAIAQTNDDMSFIQPIEAVLTFFSSGLEQRQVLLLALIGGTITFAILAAVWLIRERNQTEENNRQLALRNANLKAANERYEALVHVNDQRVVLWGGEDSTPQIYGNLKAGSGAPENPRVFLKFGTWLTPDSCTLFENALARLRQKAESFDICIQSKSGFAIEAQGRTSGAHAFVRFIELSGERAALSNLEVEHTRLMATFDTIQKLLDTIKMPVWLTKPDKSLYWVNQAYADAVGGSGYGDTLENDLQLLEKSQKAIIRQHHQQAEIFQGNFPIIVNGDRCDFDVTELSTSDGNIGIAIDKSEIDQLKTQLDQLQQSHANTLDQMATAVAMFDADKKLIFFNSGFQKLWGLEEEFLESFPSHSALLDKLRDNSLLPQQSDWRSWKEAQFAVYRNVENTQDWWYLPDSRILRVLTSPQALGGATLIFEDVTEEMELKSNYKSLMKVQGETLDHLSEAVMVFGSDGKLRLSNPILATMLDLPGDAIKPQMHISELSQLLGPKIQDAETWQEVALNVTGFDAERSSGKGHLEFLNGKVLEFGVVPLPMGQTMLTLLDITAVINVERALTERNEALEEAGSMKNRFLQHVSYELRTPLTTILGYGEMLSMKEHGTLNQAQAQYVNHINASSRTLRAIIDDILDLATIDAGVMTLDLKSINIHAEIDKVVDSLDGMLQESNVSIAVDPTIRDISLIADPVRFRQIVYNLLSNAIAHSPTGSNVKIEAMKNGDEVKISVIDDGPGVPEELHHTIFNRFETSGSKGTGLGLSIVKSFVELHNGKVSLDKKDDDKAGAKFTCSFPVSPPNDLHAA